LRNKMLRLLFNALIIMKKLFSLVLFLTILWGCKEKEYIYEEFRSPTIEFLSTRILSKNACEIELKINLGVGVSFKAAYVTLTDITTSDGITTTHVFTLLVMH